MNRFFLFSFALFFFNVDVSTPVDNKEAEKKTEKVLAEKASFAKKFLSFDMTHNHFIIFGSIIEVGPFSVFGSILTVLSSNTYNQESIPETEYQYSCVRNFQLEIGGMYEFLPFFGCMVSVFSKELLNGGAENLKSIAGGRVGVFVHLSRIWVEGGLLIKESHKGKLFSVKDYGVSLFVSFKLKKDSFFIGAGGIF